MKAASRPAAGQHGPVLGGVKGPLALLGGCTALDPACAPGGMATAALVNQQSHASVRPDAAEAIRVQVHLRLRRDDAELLRDLADERGQTLSGAVRYLLRPFRNRRA